MKVIFILILVGLLWSVYRLWRQYTDNIKQINDQFLLQKLKEETQQRDALKERFIQKEENRKIVQAKPRIYELNTTPVMFDLYPKESFEGYHIRKIYEQIVLENYLIEEPLYSSSVRLLSAIDKSQLFIKSLNSKSIKMNIRNDDGIVERTESFKVVAITEISYHFLSKLYNSINKHSYNKEEMQISFVSLTLWLIAKSYQVQSMYSSLEVKDLFEELVELLLLDSKDEILSNLESVQYYENNTWVDDAYKEAAKTSREYPYVEGNPKQNEVLLEHGHIAKQRVLLS